MQHFLYENNLLNSIECFIIGVFERQEKLPSIVAHLEGLNEFYQDNQKHLIKTGDWIWFYPNPKQQVMIYNLGNENSYQDQLCKNQLEKICQLLKTKSYKTVLFSLPKVATLSEGQQLQQNIIHIEASLYQFLNYKTKQDKLTIETIYHDCHASQSIIDETAAIVSGIQFCQNLANMPANDLTPIELEKAAIELCLDFKSLECHSLDENQMKKLGMNSLLAVAQGSNNPPRLVEIHYKNQNSHQKPIVLIGKGITFDSGGINIKPSEGMYEMKYDMSGAAAVLGTIKAIAMLKLPIHVIGILACAENMPSGHASRPGDVIKTMQGITVEITNTDAEGRLVLADAMCYAQKYQPAVMLDIATLTGAVIVALGSVFSGLMTPNDDLAKSLLKAGQQTLDKIWRLPMDSEYDEQLQSPIADLVNSHNSRAAGSIIGAQFLQHFAQQIPWAHLDIAGSAWISGKNRQATGRPVALLIEWMKNFKHEN
jgi:leucyl aminopeptidase